MAIRQEGNTYYGLSTDTKPTGAVLNGREFKEMDTGKKYLFDEENGEWLEQPEEGGGGGGGSSTLSGLTDVDISNPTDGQTLVYNATSGKWENGAGGGGVLVVNVQATRTSDGSTATFDKTFAELKSAYEGGAVMLCQVATEDNVNGVSGHSIAFLTYRPATQFPFPSHEAFVFEASFLQMQNVVHGCFVTCEITAERTAATIYTAELTAAN